MLVVGIEFGQEPNLINLLETKYKLTSADKSVAVRNGNNYVIQEISKEMTDSSTIVFDHNPVMKSVLKKITEFPADSGMAPFTYYSPSQSDSNISAAEEDLEILKSPSNVVVIATSDSLATEVKMSNDGTKTDIIRASIANAPLSTVLKPKSLKISGAFEFTGYNKFSNAKDTEVKADNARITFIGQDSLFQVPMRFENSYILFDGRYGPITFDYPITSINSSINVIGDLYLRNEIHWAEGDTHLGGEDFDNRTPDSGQDEDVVAPEDLQQSMSKTH